MGMFEKPNVEEMAEADASQAWEFITYSPAANATEIAESIEEPAVLIEQIIRLLYGPGYNSETRYAAIGELINAATRKYANDQAEAAHNHRMTTPL